MNSTTKFMVALVFLLVYGSLIHSINSAALQTKIQAAEVRKTLEVSEDAHGAELPEKVRRLEEQAGQYQRSIQLVNMSLMFLVLWAGLWPFTRKALDRGIVGVSEKIRDAERRAEVARGALEQAEAQMAKIDEDTAAILDRERKAAEAEGSRLRDMASKEAAQIQAHAELSVKRQEKRVQGELLARVAGKALDQALEGFADQIDDATRQRLNRIMVEGFEA